MHTSAVAPTQQLPPPRAPVPTFQTSPLYEPSARGVHTSDGAPFRQLLPPSAPAPISQTGPHADSQTSLPAQLSTVAGAYLLAPNPPILQCSQSAPQTALPLAQHTPTRFALIPTTVVAPAVPQTVMPFALPAPIAFAAAQPAALQPTVVP